MTQDFRFIFNVSNGICLKLTLDRFYSCIIQMYLLMFLFISIGFVRLGRFMYFSPPAPFIGKVFLSSLLTVDFYQHRKTSLCFSDLLAKRLFFNQSDLSFLSGYSNSNNNGKNQVSTKFESY